MDSRQALEILSENICKQVDTCHQSANYFVYWLHRHSITTLRAIGNFRRWSRNDLRISKWSQDREMISGSRNDLRISKWSQDHEMISKSRNDLRIMKWSQNPEMIWGSRTYFRQHEYIETIPDIVIFEHICVANISWRGAGKKPPLKEKEHVKVYILP